VLTGCAQGPGYADSRLAEQAVAVLDFRSPRQAAASAAEGNMAEALRLKSLLRQLEYQAGLAAARGGRPIDTE
jgi:hypothetical protein